MTADLMTTTVAAAHLGVSVRTVARLVADGNLAPACTLPGGGWLFTPATVERTRRELLVAR